MAHKRASSGLLGRACAGALLVLLLAAASLPGGAEAQDSGEGSPSLPETTYDTMLVVGL
jgi:hypothetical protein